MYLIKVLVKRLLLLSSIIKSRGITVFWYNRLRKESVALYNVSKEVCIFINYLCKRRKLNLLKERAIKEVSLSPIAIYFIYYKPKRICIFYETSLFFEEMGVLSLYGLEWYCCHGRQWK